MIIKLVSRNGATTKLVEAIGVRVALGQNGAKVLHPEFTNQKIPEQIYIVQNDSEHDWTVAYLMENGKTIETIKPHN